MKAYLSVFALFLFCLTGYSQPGDYSGPAKVTVNSFWDAAGKLEQSVARGGSSLDKDNLVSLQRKIFEIKAKDPTYNTALMETKLASLKEGIDGNVKKNTNASVSVMDKLKSTRQFTEALKNLFYYSTQLGNADLPGIKERIATYKQKTAVILTMDRSNATKELEAQKTKLKIAFRLAEKDLYELDRRCREQTNKDNAAVRYYELMLTQAYWDAARQVYPDESDFTKANDIASKLLTGLGTIEQVYALAEKSKEQKINDTRLPEPAVVDPALEKLFLDIFNENHAAEFKGKAIRAVVTSKDWSVQRHEITGIITGRTRRAVIVYKTSEGKCYLTGNFFLHQEYIGSSFTSATTSPYGILGSQEMRCQNVR
jgi:hypothetical protein